MNLYVEGIIKEIMVETEKTGKNEQRAAETWNQLVKILGEVSAQFYKGSSEARPEDLIIIGQALKMSKIMRDEYLNNVRAIDENRAKLEEINSKLDDLSILMRVKE